MTVGEQQQQIKDPNKSLEIRVFTLNIWGIPNISKDREARVQAIAQHLTGTHEPYHYVFLQEVWSKTDFQFLADKVSKILPFSHYFYSGVNGSGTCIFSCSPIHEVHFHPYSLNGYPHKILHGDWYGGKGLAFCKTTYQGIPILLINTHLHAEYDDDKDEYIHHRVAQAYEISQILRFAKYGHHLTIFGGDLNCTTADVPYRLLTYNTGLIDTYLDCALKPADGVGATNETPSNSYTPLKALRNNPNGKRIDYVFYWVSDQYQVKTLVHDQPLPHRVPQKEFSYSDHEGVRTVLSIKLKQNNPEQDEKSKKEICFDRTHSLLDASAVCAQGLRIVSKAQKMYAWLAALMFILQMTVLGLILVDMHPGGRFVLFFLLVLLSIGFGFSVYMALVFSNQEHSAVMATKLGLERLLDEVRQKNAKYFEEQKKLSSARQ
ncbi:putative neutral sphingomyelinase [Armadillidium vulgare]|nr:putative neutral sphingomyelinase [Armadillidium vulgare]